MSSKEKQAFTGISSTRPSSRENNAPATNLRNTSMDTLSYNLNLPYKFFWIGLTITALTTLFVSTYHHLDVTQIATLIATGFTLTTLAYAALTFNLNLKVNEEKLSFEKKLLAINFISEWHHPDMSGFVRTTRLIRDDLKPNVNQGNDHVVTLLNSDPAKREAVITILNYFEKVAVAIKYDAADDQVLRDYLAGPLRLNFHAFEPFINHLRGFYNDHKLFELLATMSKRWEDK